MPRKILGAPDSQGFQTVSKRKSRSSAGETDTTFEYMLDARQQAALIKRSLTIKAKDGRPTLYWIQQIKNLCGLLAANHVIGELMFTEQRLRKIADQMFKLALEAPDGDSRLHAFEDDDGNITPLYDETGNFHIAVFFAAFEIYFGEDAFASVRLEPDVLTHTYVQHSNLLAHYPTDQGHYVAYVYNDGWPWDLETVAAGPKLIFPSQDRVTPEVAAKHTVRHLLGSRPDGLPLPKQAKRARYVSRRRVVRRRAARHRVPRRRARRRDRSPRCACLVGDEQQPEYRQG